MCTEARVKSTIFIQLPLSRMLCQWWNNLTKTINAQRPSPISFIYCLPGKISYI
jgi:hypothetical protein